jgi:hypothetical protein
MSTTESSWKLYCSEEIELLTPILKNRGYTIDAVQPHIAGERYLMQAVTTTSGRKLILLGARSDGTRVVIKATRDQSGIRELAHEARCREVLHKIDFAAKVFHTPDFIERLYEQGFVIIITRFIPQEMQFLERPLAEQFDLALRSFKAQEGAHATTWNHRKLIRDTFGIRDAATYLSNFDQFLHNILQKLPGEKLVQETLHGAQRELKKQKRIIEQYCDFLTHTDFVPHNIRVDGEKIILLDHSSLTFGNKYEGWARFLNFMTLYNQEIERALVHYVKDNRTPEESVSLRMMRVYRLGEIIWYYVQTLEKSTGNLLTLNHARVAFWSTVLSYILEDKQVPESVIREYQKTRDSLRSEDEKKRQIGLH